MKHIRNATFFCSIGAFVFLCCSCQLSGKRPRVLSKTEIQSFSSSIENTYLIYVTPSSGRAFFGHLLLRTQGTCFAYDFGADGFIPEIFTLENAIDNYVIKQQRSLLFLRLDLDDIQTFELASLLKRIINTYENNPEAIKPVFYLNNCSTLLIARLQSVKALCKMRYLQALFPKICFETAKRLSIFGNDVFVIAPETNK